VPATSSPVAPAERECAAATSPAEGGRHVRVPPPGASCPLSRKTSQATPHLAERSSSSAAPAIAAHQPAHHHRPPHPPSERTTTPCRRAPRQPSPPATVPRRAARLRQGPICCERRRIACPLSPQPHALGLCGVALHASAHLVRLPRSSHAPSPTTPRSPHRRPARRLAASILRLLADPLDLRSTRRAANDHR
jgi:hypothetical protein